VIPCLDPDVIIRAPVGGRLTRGILQQQRCATRLLNDPRDLPRAGPVIPGVDKREQVAASHGLDTQRIGIAAAIVVQQERLRGDARALMLLPGRLNKDHRRVAGHQASLGAQPLPLHGVRFPVMEVGVGDHLGQGSAEPRAPHGPLILGDAWLIERQSVGQRGEEELAMLLRNAVPSVGDLPCRMLHRADAVGQEIPRPPSCGECPHSIGKVGRGVLVLAAQEGINDRSTGRLMPRTKAAESLKEFKRCGGGRLQDTPWPRRQMVADGHWRRRGVRRHGHPPSR